MSAKSLTDRQRIILHLCGPYRPVTVWRFGDKWEDVSGKGGQEYDEAVKELESG